MNTCSLLCININVSHSHSDTRVDVEANMIYISMTENQSTRANDKQDCILRFLYGQSYKIDNELNYLNNLEVVIQCDDVGEVRVRRRGRAEDFPLAWSRVSENASPSYSRLDFRS